MLRMTACVGKKLRKELKLTQTGFGEKIGITAAAISDIENGRRNLTPRNISLICEKFPVNPSWFCDGTGEMFDLEHLPEDPLSRALSEIESETYQPIKQLLMKYIQLDDAGKKIVNDFLDYILNHIER